MPERIAVIRYNIKHIAQYIIVVAAKPHKVCGNGDIRIDRFYRVCLAFYEVGGLLGHKSEPVDVKTVNTALAVFIRRINLRKIGVCMAPKRGAPVMIELIKRFIFRLQPFAEAFRAQRAKALTAKLVADMPKYYRGIIAKPLG